MDSDLLSTVIFGNLPRLQWLLAAGGASIKEVDDAGNTPLLLAAEAFHFAMCHWFLEFGGSDIQEANNEGTTVWDFLTWHFVGDGSEIPLQPDLTALLRCMVLRCTPPAELVEQASPETQADRVELIAEVERLYTEHVRVVEASQAINRHIHESRVFLMGHLYAEHALVLVEGTHMRAELPAYLVRRLALINIHCALLALLCAYVCDYEEPTTAEEIRATGLDAASQRSRRRRPRQDYEAVLSLPLRRSARLRLQSEE
jgi:hypothetical protein